MKNRYEIRGDTTAIFIESKKYGNIETLISTEMLERVKKFPGSWYVTFQKQAGTFYVKGDVYAPNKVKKFFLHRWIMEAEKGLQVDHINNDTLNNTNGNLRIVTIAQNAQNRKGAQINNKSCGIRGVTWSKANKKWQARVKLNGKALYFGSYENVDDARTAVERARAKLMPFSQEAI